MPPQTPVRAPSSHMAPSSKMLAWEENCFGSRLHFVGSRRHAGKVMALLGGGGDQGALERMKVKEEGAVPSPPCSNLQKRPAERLASPPWVSSGRGSQMLEMASCPSL